jgi:heat shock protein HspQ
MNRKTILALALASAFGLSAFSAYAEDEKKETEKPQVVAEDEQKKDSPFPQLIADEDEQKKDSPFPQLLADEDKKDSPYPQVIADEEEQKKDSPFPQLLADEDKKDSPYPQVIADEEEQKKDSPFPQLLADEDKKDSPYPLVIAEFVTSKSLGSTGAWGRKTPAPVLFSGNGDARELALACLNEISVSRGERQRLVAHLSAVDLDAPLLDQPRGLRGTRCKLRLFQYLCNAHR